MEGGYRREVRSGLLAAALEEAFGPRKQVTDREFDRWTDGVPVEVLEAPEGPPFVIVGRQAASAPRDTAPLPRRWRRDRPPAEGPGTQHCRIQRAARPGSARRCTASTRSIAFGPPSRGGES